MGFPSWSLGTEKRDNYSPQARHPIAHRHKFRHAQGFSPALQVDVQLRQDGAHRLGAQFEGCRPGHQGVIQGLAAVAEGGLDQLVQQGRVKGHRCRASGTSGTSRSTTESTWGGG